MIIHSEGRGQGKTTKCILELAENPQALLIVGNGQMKDFLIKRYKGFPGLKERIVTAQHAKQRGYCLNGRDIIIDELDIVLKHLFDNSLINIKFATITEK